MTHTKWLGIAAAMAAGFFAVLTPIVHGWLMWWYLTVFIWNARSAMGSLLTYWREVDRREHQRLIQLVKDFESDEKYERLEIPEVIVGD